MLDLSDPQSIASWYRIEPVRHAAFLRWALRCESYARFHDAIVASRELVRQ